MRSLAAAIGIGAIFVSAPLARADFFGSGPGPLSQAHQALDQRERCGDCHVDPRHVEEAKCVTCHAPIASRKREHRGLHASARAVGRPCQTCHGEHRGRAANILGWDTVGGKERFDHATVTGFALDGKHRDVACLSCHKKKNSQGKPSLLLDSRSCASCHDNPHGPTRETHRQCEHCHDARSWQMKPNLIFDHDRDTRYPLEKKHDGVACVSCHLTQSSGKPPASKTATGSGKSAPAKLTFRWPTWPLDCTPCHQNVHGDSLFGRRGCRLCHSAEAVFSKISFDHNKRTHFPLDGAHADPKQATCASCHKKEERVAPARACQTCHTDAHNGRFDRVSNRDCGLCHGATAWTREIRFPHAAKTRFALTGQHAKATCRNCHRGNKPTEWERFEGITVKTTGNKTTVACMNCHTHSNAHQKQYTNEQCLGCHKLAGAMDTKPQAVAEFHGPASKFPLTEGHKNVDCGKCHTGGIFTNAPTQCGPTCHVDRLHKGTLGTDCTNCHAGGRWDARRFDHATKTKFPLVGNHRDVPCESCHARKDFAAAQGKGDHCVNCHLKDDVHKGALGRICETCHEPTGKRLFDHNDPKKSDWMLVGAHKTVACGKCHSNVLFKPTPRDCAGCHSEPEVHRGQYGVICGNCHVEEDWKKIHNGHDRSVPRISGAHDRLRCGACHTQSRLLAGTGPLCITCHRNDDIHHNALGPKCGDCHTQQSFANARFEHSRVGCDLVGVHRLLPCVSCHVGGNFTAIAPQCVACHRKDAIRGAAAFGSDAHRNFSTCTNCHNPNFFGPQAGGTAATMRESVCR